MKTQSVLLLAIILAASLRIASAADPLTDAFQKGLLEEEANRNLDAAIQAYQSVLKQLDDQRKLAATTIFRLGECYRKLGKTNEATSQFQRIVREFPDQDVLAKMSQQNLTALGKGDDTKPRLLGVPILDVETQEIEKLRKMLKESPDLINAVTPGDTRTPLARAAEFGQKRVVKFLLEDSHVDVSRDILHRATKVGHLGIVELLLAHGVDVNSLDHEGLTALHWAIGQGFRSIAEALIANKANVNAKRTSDGESPLHLAVRGQSQPLVESLQSKGADPNARSNGGQTPLFSAVGNPRMTALLLAEKADVNASDSSGRTPLYAAVESGNLETSEILLKNGADVNARIISFINKEVQPPDTISPGAPGGVNVIQAGRSVSCNGFTSLHLAALTGREALVRVLIAHKADVNASASQERTPLYLAVTYSTPAVVKALLERGADVNAVSPEDSVSPLIRAVWRKSEEMTSIILAHKPNLEQRNPDGLTALQITVSYRLDRLMEMLLAAGADPNVVYERGNGETPLHWAVSNRSRQTVEALLKHKANPNAADAAGKTPLDYAKALAPQPSAQSRRGTQITRGPRFAVPTSNEIVSDIIQLLRKAGATEYPQRDRSIMIGRGDSFSVVFSKDAPRDNQYTLMLALGLYYRDKLAGLNSQSGGAGTPSLPQTPGFGRGTQGLPPLEFPDFSRIQIRRKKQDTASGDETIHVNLQQALQSADSSKDTVLEWGDMIEIPEKDHKPEKWAGLPFEESEPLRRCLRRAIRIVVKDRNSGGSRDLALDLLPSRPYPYAEFPDWRSIPSPFSVTSFRLDEVLRAASVHRTSSDLTRVRVLRADPNTKQAQETIVNLFDPSRSFWLREGDVIEVPEKE
ncbi:MAG: ankyrin repeat domain-containing protein [Verrucomicrobia bacterium]|nr:ankyrin repeat domain-containing protein [Verrucomicrobiota bacterium]